MQRKAKLKGYIFIFKQNGMPRIDNPLDVPQSAWDSLTIEQQEYANDQVVKERKRTIHN